MDKNEILRWADKYDIEEVWWVQKEKEIGDRLRANKELTKADLVEIIEWKFKDLEARRKRILGLVDENKDQDVRRISSHILSLGIDSDSYKVESLCCVLHGVGPAVASTILTFYNPQDYGVFDIHVWRELFGKEPENLFTPRNYLVVLSRLREIASGSGLCVRTVEKSLFKKNYDESQKT